ncbi:DUF2017 domain-containing protein [Nocardioides sp. TRM66260-LWL]|uniref:DUF2017 domain-containing protein n=1 Tax=Nocardioides sp. TRM66260-LWL TaxID=2874478 RepID=UPI001CC56877|nr:DUF2017 domain-containing protein [Nocardioides sp. TRM66260-LWL]MBZ5732942.1 DUF2017 domain-containing protein [Nocardioides sp. TRM66260-LWL]
MSGFVRHRRSGAIIATFTGLEADLLRSMASQLIELLRDQVAAPTESDDPLEAMLDFSGPSQEPDDPALARLFPTAYADDEEAAGDFRRYTEQSLRSGKVAAASTVIDLLEDAGLPAELDEDDLMIDLELDQAEAMAWLRCLNDLRLTLAVRLEIEDEHDHVRLEALPDDDPRVWAFDVYDYFGGLQSTLVDALEG